MNTTTPSRAARTGVLAAAALTLMAAAVIAPSLPAMAAAFHDVAGSAVLVRLALTVTSLAIAVTAPLAGMLIDRIGRRPLLLASLALYTVGGVAGFAVSDLGPLLVTRAALGVGVGGIMTAVSTLITDWFQGPRRASFLGLQQAEASLVGVVFLPLAGVLAQVSWHAPFLLYWAGVLVLPLVLVAVREPQRPARALAAPATRGAVAAEGTRWRIVGIASVALVVTLVFFMAPTQLPFSLRGMGASTAMTGVVVAGSTATGAIGALAFGRVRARLTATVITAASVLLLGAGWIVIGTASGLPQVIAGVLLGGIGAGLAVPNLNHRLAELASPASRGRILGSLVAAIFLGQFLSPLVLQPLIHAVGIPAAFSWTGAALALGALATAAAALRTARAPGAAPEDLGTTGTTTTTTERRSS